MDFVFVVRQRLEQLGLGQRELADAVEVTESYISQLMGRKKLPPLPNRTDLYDKMSKALGLPREELARLAATEHHRALAEKWKETPPARFGPMRELILRKCRPARLRQMRAIFEKEPFGEIEKAITRLLITAVRDEARTHARDEGWLRGIAKRGRDTYRQMRVRMIDLLESDPRNSLGDYSLFLDPLLERWDFDVEEFTLLIELASGTVRRFGFREESNATDGEVAGLRKFLRDPTLSASATAEEIDILRRIEFPAGRRPTALFYYRMLQSLRDSLHFTSPSPRQSSPRSAS
jgi:transcriptional regulator with XRE-family HTH domain